MEVNIIEKLYKEIKEYCELNELDEEKFINDTLRSGFTIAKYGMSPHIPMTILEPETEKPKDNEKKDIYDE